MRRSGQLGRYLPAQKGAVLHTQWIKYLVLDIELKRLARHLGNDIARNLKSGIAIGVALTRFGDHFFTGKVADITFKGIIVIVRLMPGIFVRIGHTSGMAQHLTTCNLPRIAAL